MIHSYINFNQAQQQLANICPIDYFFAREMVMTFIDRDIALSNEDEKVLIHVFIALSMSLREGHSCLPITEIANLQWAVANDANGMCSHQGYLFPSSSIIIDILTMLNLSESAQQPLVFENNNLYMRRYYQFECEVVQGINERLQPLSLTSNERVSLVMQKLFPSNLKVAEAKETEQTIDWQKVAVANAINKNFAVIAGGPGTGKTYTVTKLLAALLMLQENTNSNNKSTTEIALVAPTGKAAQRLSESIINAIAGFKGLIEDSILSLMPTQAKTIHRLLGVIPNSPNFRHNENNLLSCDVLLIDEVSMVDLPMMARIFRALKPDAKVILLGDADQLPSVAVGSILADIAPRPHHGYSDNNVNYLAQVCELDETLLQTQIFNNDSSKTHDYLSFLIKSRRFDGEGGIGKIATNVIQGKTSQSWSLLESSLSSLNSDLNQLNLVGTDISQWLAPLVDQYYKKISQCEDIKQAFELLSKFRVLCATRQGEYGVDALNQRIKEQLTMAVHSPLDGYHGMPIMVNENDYRLGLYNGDIGLLWHTDNGQLMAYFESNEGNTANKQTKQVSTTSGFNVFHPSRLPKYDAVYAMTIHKTQGSEFEHVAIVLPKQTEHKLLSRELLYTGITRAKTKLTISSDKQTWQFSVKTAIKRYSGLLV